MHCPNHHHNEATGYCSICGTFGCDECMTEHEGQLLCPRHYRPIAKKLEEERKHERQRKKHARQRLVVRYKDGHMEYGVALALNPRERGFHLERVDERGIATSETVQVRFSELKALFYVKSFDGKFDRSQRFREWTPEGSELVVRFKDAEVIRGYSLRSYDPADEHFYLIPKDEKSNNISVLVEASAVERVCTPEEFEKTLKKEREALKQQEGGTTLTQEETMGDFYFETRNYPLALEQYEIALKHAPKSYRLRKKILSVQYNLGIQHIKQREYPKALAKMEQVLSVYPENKHARKKAAQLRRIIEKTAHEKAENKSSSGL